MDPILPSQGLIDLLSTIELFHALPVALIREMAVMLQEETVPGGATLIQQGTTGDSLYVVISGRLRISNHAEWGEEVLAECGPGELVGEIAFLTGQVRSATATAIESTRVLQLPRVYYEDIERRHPEAVADISAILSRRLKRSQLGLGLRSTGLFGTLDEPVLTALESDLELVTLHGGETLFRQGDAGDSLYIVINGRLRVAIQGQDGKERSVAELGRGETVGEMAMLGGELRSATVYAVRDTNLARLSRASFDRHLAEYPHAIAPIFTKKIVARLQQQISSPESGADILNTIAVAPASVGVDLEAFCTRLTAALSRYGRCLHLNQARFDALLWRGASDATEHDHTNSVIVERLARVEADHRYVVYQTGDSDSVWTRRCARQADHILLVGRGSADPQPLDVERALQEALGAQSAKLSLVLLHEDASRLPSGTAKWLAPRRVDGHYHVRTVGDGDYERVARTLTRNALGLVLGGGSARGLGHVGVVRALEELALPIDFVGGTSMGAAMALECGIGLDWEKMLETTKGMANVFQGDMTIPIVALLKGRIIARLILDQLNGHDIDIEDMWLPFFAISANLTRMRMEVHTRGSLLTAVLASTRLPGVYPPIVSDGDLLIDGGIIDNVPVDVMKPFSKGARVLAIDVSPPVDTSMTADFGYEVSGFRLLYERLNPFSTRKARAVNVTTILARTIGFGNATRRGTGLAAEDLYLQIPLETFRIDEFKRAKEMADVAYQFALPRIRAWQSEAQPISVAPVGTT